MNSLAAVNVTLNVPMPVNWARSAASVKFVAVASGAPPISAKPIPSNVSNAGPVVVTAFEPLPDAVPATMEYDNVRFAEPVLTKPRTPVGTTLNWVVVVVETTEIAVSMPRAGSNFANVSVGDAVVVVFSYVASREIKPEDTLPV
jgi:hypothetical protein